MYNQDGQHGEALASSMGFGSEVAKHVSFQPDPGGGGGGVCFYTMSGAQNN